MAGVKGRSGGARRGAGRPRKSAAIEQSLEPQSHGGALKREREVPVPVEVEGDDMLTLLKQVALGRVEVSALQVRAAIAAVQYEHSKPGEGGKKDARRGAAKSASSGIYAPAAPPRMVQ